METKNDIFISGHLDLTQEEFDEHYKGLISKAALRNCSFVIGDARGCDLMAQNFLKELLVSNVIVYHMFEKPRNNPHDFKTVGGFKTDDERDEAMTKISIEDIAWVREGREKSGTAKNIMRRKALWTLKN